MRGGESCKSLVLLEVVDGGEGTLVWHKEGSKRGEEEEVCNQCQEEGRGANKGSGWLATPTGCRLLAQVKPSFFFCFFLLAPVKPTLFFLFLFLLAQVKPSLISDNHSLCLNGTFGQQPLEKESDMFQCKLLEMMACLMGCSCFNKGDDTGNGFVFEGQ